YYLQKVRHYGASKAYKSKHKRMLTIQLITALFFYILLIACFAIYPYFGAYLLASYFIRLFVQVMVYHSAMKKLQVGDLLIFLPLLDIIYYFYTCFGGFVSLFKKKVKWK